MLLCGQSGGLRLPACFPRGGGTLFGRLVGHSRQSLVDGPEVFLRYESQCFAAADQAVEDGADR